MVLQKGSHHAHFAILSQTRFLAGPIYHVCWQRVVLRGPLSYQMGPYSSIYPSSRIIHLLASVHWKRTLLLPSFYSRSLTRLRHYADLTWQEHHQHCPGLEGKQSSCWSRPTRTSISGKQVKVMKDARVASQEDVDLKRTRWYLMMCMDLDRRYLFVVF